ncbi:MAG: radical SAM/SPASM domain-containing protein [Thermodesulfovibrionales bacterium]|nr:radical SAM/SPASM domain-containing protein [Thermodesulfovibrionales bacterium]
MYRSLRHIASIFWKRKPLQLTFFVTRRCNAKCPFCFYLKNTDIARDKPEELSLDEIQKISKSLGNLLWVAFSGGEIYLRDDLVEISKIFYENNKPAIMLYPTNGLLPELIKERTEQILKNSPKSIIAVKLSIDGLYGMHDEIRNTPGSFDKTMETYEMLGGLLDKYPDFELGINTVFCSENQDKMDEIIDFAGSLKNIKTHTISMVRGNLSDESFKKIDFKKYLASTEKLEKNLKNKTSPTYRFKGARIKAAQDILQRRLIHQTMLEQRRLIPCYAGRLNLVLTENGDVYPCEILTESLGNARNYDYDLGKVIQSGKAQQIIHSIQAKQCFCTHECYLMTNILFNPGLYYKLAKEYVQLR